MFDSLKRLRKETEAIAFLLPHFVFFILFVLSPLIYATYLSLHNWTILGKPSYIGLDNFFRIWRDARFWEAVRNTVIFATISVPLIVFLGIALALLLRLDFHGKTWPLLAFVSPAFFGSVGILLSWNWVLASSPSGLANYYLGRFGVISGGFSYFDKPITAWASIIVITAWWIVGFSVLLYLGALQRIPPEQYESAMIDGAGPWTRFRCITLPWIRNVIFFDLARHVLLAFGLFDQVFVLTTGGPGGATRTMVYYLYMIGFERQHFGRAAAISWYIFLLIIIFGFIQLLLLTKSVKAVEE